MKGESMRRQTFMHRWLAMWLVLLVSLTSAFAIPADPTPFKLKLTDGTEVLVRAVGDESFSYLITLDGGVPVVADGASYRLAPEKKASLEATRRALFFERNEPMMAQMRKRMAAKTASSAPLRALRRPEADRFVGDKSVLVILVEFPDQEFTFADRYNDFFNKVGYSYDNHTGSVHDYFYDNSSGKFNLTFDVVGPVKLSEKSSYYGQNETDTAGIVLKDKYAKDMVTEACMFANVKADIDWSKYDWDGDKVVDQVCIIYAGLSEATHQTDTTLIWPKQGFVESKDGKESEDGKVSTSLMIDGYRINRYSLVNELNKEGLFSKTMDGIGTFCHEFSHCLSLPDFYDIDKEENGLGTGMGYWDLMDSGSYNGKNGRGESPAGYSAFERWYFGWMDLVELDKSSKVSLPALDQGDTPHACAIYKDSSKEEFIILENRQNSKWFRYVNKSNDLHGLFVYRANIQYAKDWIEKYVNILGNHQMMTYIPANKCFGSKSLNGQLFPAGSPYLTSESHTDVNGHWFPQDENNPQIWDSFDWAIDNIEEKNGVVTFAYKKTSAGEQFGDHPTRPDLSLPDRYLYWIDDADTASVGSQYFDIDISKLDLGIHTLFTQVVTDVGYGDASDVVATTFYKYSYPDEETHLAVMVDDKLVDGVQIDSNDLTAELELETSGLGLGLHKIQMFAYNTSGYQTDVAETNFYKYGQPAEKRWAAMIDGELMEKGMMRRDSVPTEIDLWTLDLSIGFHKLQMFVYDSLGYQTDVAETYFYKMAHPLTSNEYQMVCRIDDGDLQYFSWKKGDLDHDRRFEVADAKGLSRGFHQLYYHLATIDGSMFTEDTVTFNLGDGMIGDVNGDDEVNVLDILQIICLSASGKVTLGDPSVMDLDGNGVVDAEDIKLAVPLILEVK